MASTTATNVTTAIRTKWETDVLAIADGELVSSKFATTKIMGRGEGGTLKLNRLLRAAKQTSSATYGTLIAAASAKNLISNTVDITPTLWQDYFGFNEEVDLKAFFTDEDYKKTIGQQMANSLDYQCQKTLCRGIVRHRGDANASATEQATSTVSGTPTTTSIVCPDLTGAINTWNGGFITVTNPEGPGYDETHLVDTWTLTTTTIALAAADAFTNAPTSASKVRVTVGTGLTTADIMKSNTAYGLLGVAALHRKFETQKFPGGVLHGFLDAANEADLWTDTNFINNANYDASQRFSQYRLVRWLDQELLITSNGYRESVAGVASETGAVYVSPIFGMGTYALVKWGMGQGDYGVKFHIVDTPDSGNLTLNQRFVSWQAHVGMKVLRATSGVGLMTVPTSLNVLV